MWRVWGYEKGQRGGVKGEGAYTVASRARLTLSLHPGAHQSQRVTGHLATGRGQRHRRQADQATWVFHVPA